MSWWNASNFTDLASKALKNAQKQIDKALDIQDSEGSPSTERKAQGASAKADTGDKGDFWSSWLGETPGGSEVPSASAKNAWSLPWGTGTDQDSGKSVELAPEKTAEEIKKEVLKAAKERTKAKSKLFPPKANKGTESKAKELIKPEEASSKSDFSKETKDVISTGDSVKQEQKVLETGLCIEQAVEQKDISAESQDKDIIKKSDPPSSENFENSNMSETDNLHKENDGEKESCFKEISEDDKGLNLILDTSSQLSEQDSNVRNVDIDAVSVPESSTDGKFVEELSVKKNVDNTEEKIPEQTVQEDVIKPMSKSDLGAPDISSSVEFVTEQDIEFSEPVNAKDIDSCDNVGSDPEIIDICDKVELSETEDAQGSSDIVSGTQPTQTSIDMDQDTDRDRLFDKLPSTGQENISISGTAQNSTPENLCDIATDVIQTEQQDTERLANIMSSDSESSMSKLDISMDTCTSDETLVDVVTPMDEDDNQIQGSECQEILNVKIDDIDQGQKSNDDSASNDLLQISHEVQTKDETEPDTSSPCDKGQLSPANSYVKCMLEDAIDDSKQDDNSDSHSATEKSDGSRSVYSNHESSDEVDTTTSSDIEIISMPTPNGENRQVSPVDPIPLRIALQKTSWPSPTHRRTDSSDSSNTSKDGGYAELSPGRESYEYSDNGCRIHTDTIEGHKAGPELPALDEEDDPLHPQKLLKKLAEVSEILQVREDKLLQLSKENCDLMETNNILRNQLKQAEEAREAEMTDINELTAEFTQRLTDSEKRISSILKEKETLKKQLQDAQAEIAKRAGDISLKEILSEKEEQIAELMQEGEKLSKSQLQSNNIIKKLRQKEKDNDSTIASQKKKIETQKEELDHLHKVLESKEELEKKQTEAITQLSAAVKKQEQELIKLKSDNEDATEKLRGLQTALDNSYKEMAELHRNNAAQDSKAQEIALSAEMQVREELKLQIEKQQQQYKWEKESLGMQIEDLQMTMTKMEKDHSRREDLLRQEIADLQKQLQEDEARTQELTQGVSLATRPLLRQIENLQSTFNAQSATWEKVEKNLSDRLSEAQNQLAIVTEKERNANEQMIELGSKVSTLEAQTSRLRQEKSQMTAHLEMLKSKVEMAEDAKQHETAQLEVKKQQLQQEISDVRKEKVLLETQLDFERSKVEQEKKKSNILQEQVRDLERELQGSRSRVTPVRTTPSPVSVSRQNSLIGSLHEQSFQSITQEEIDRSFYLSSPNGNKQSLYEALRQSGAANLLENLQSQLKLRDGEILHLQDEIKSLERTRESMAKELVDLSNKNDDLEEKVKDLPLLQSQHKELDQRYNALLQMYGEKVEEANELRLDLADVKEMYKAQITQLLGQS